MQKQLLPESIQSADDLQLAIDALAEYITALSRPKHDALSVSPPAAALLNLLPATQRSDGAVVSNYCKELTLLARTAPHVHVTLPAAPSLDMEQSLVSWLRTNTHPHALVAFTQSASMLGGMVVRTPKRVYDWSFRSRLEAHVGRFCEVANSV